MKSKSTQLKLFPVAATVFLYWQVVINPLAKFKPSETELAMSKNKNTTSRSIQVLCWATAGPPPALVVRLYFVVLVGIV